MYDGKRGNPRGLPRFTFMGLSLLSEQSEGNKKPPALQVEKAIFR